MTRSNSISATIRATLQERGPLETWELASALGLPSLQVSKIASQMKQSGQLRRGISARTGSHVWILAPRELKPGEELVQPKPQIQEEKPAPPPTDPLAATADLLLDRIAERVVVRLERRLNELETRLLDMLTRPSAPTAEAAPPAPSPTRRPRVVIYRLEPAAADSLAHEFADTLLLDISTGPGLTGTLAEAERFSQRATSAAACVFYAPKAGHAEYNQFKRRLNGRLIVANAPHEVRDRLRELSHEYAKDLTS